MLAGIAAVLAIAVSVFVYQYSRPTPVQPPPDADFLTEQTLKEVESAEAAYRSSIDKLTPPRAAQTDRLRKPGGHLRARETDGARFRNRQRTLDGRS